MAAYYTHMCLMALAFVLLQMAVSGGVIQNPGMLARDDLAMPPPDRDQLVFSTDIQQFAIKSISEYVSQMAAESPRSERNLVVLKTINTAITYLTEVKHVLENKKLSFLANIPMPPDHLFGSADLQRFAMDKVRQYVIMLTKNDTGKRATCLQTVKALVRYMDTMRQVLLNMHRFQLMWPTDEPQAEEQVVA